VTAKKNIGIALIKNISNEVLIMPGKLVGILKARDEEDIIEEVMIEYEKQGFDAIYVICGGDDKGMEIIKKFKTVRWIRHESEFGLDGYSVTDGKVHQLMLDEVVKDYGYGNWVFMLNADEIYHNSIRDTINKIDTNKYNLLYTLMTTFVFHESERQTLDSEDLKESIQKRRLWYFFCRKEPRAFFNSQGMAYDVTEKRRMYPHWENDTKWYIADVLLLMKNYPARTLEQFIKRANDRWDRDWAPPYKSFLPKVFINHESEVFPDWYNPDVFPGPFQKFDGKFHLYKCMDFMWDLVVGSEKFRGEPIPNPRGI